MPLPEPTVRVKVAAVLLVTEIELMLAPVPPETENRVEAVSKVQSVFVPVAVIVGVVPVPPLAGEIVKLAAAAVRAGETTPSTVIVNVPVPAPVVTVRVAAVPLLCVQLPFVTVVVPVTLFWTETVLPDVQLVPVPVSVRVKLGV